VYVKLDQHKQARSPDKNLASFKFMDGHWDTPGMFKALRHKFGGVSKATLWRFYKTRLHGRLRGPGRTVLGFDCVKALVTWIDISCQYCEHCVPKRDLRGCREAFSGPPADG